MKKRILSFLMAVTLAATPALPAMAVSLPDTIRMEDGWDSIQLSGTSAWVYVKNGKFVGSGFQMIEGYPYYFEPLTYTDGKGNSISAAGIPFSRRGTLQGGYYTMQDWSLAVNRWIEMPDGRWAYFGSDGRQVFGKMTANGKEYDFGEDGFIAREQSPFPEMEIVSIQLGAYGQTVRAGDTAEVPFTITVRTLEKASPPNAGKWVGGEANYQIFKEAYDIGRGYRKIRTNGSLEELIATKFDIDWDRHVLKVPTSGSKLVYMGDDVGDEGKFVIRNRQGDFYAKNGFSIQCLNSPDERPSLDRAKALLAALGSIYENGDFNDFPLGPLVGQLEQANANGALKQAMGILLQERNSNLKDTFDKLEAAYMAEYGIKQSDVRCRVGSPAPLWLNDGRPIDAAGLGLSVERGEKIELVVSRSNETVPREIQNRYETVVPFDLRVFKDGSPLKKLEIPAIITLPLPKGMDSSVEVFHIRNGIAEAVSEKAGNYEVSFVADEFSTYLLAGEYVNQYPGGYLPDSAPSPAPAPSPGGWRRDQFGWWYRNPDGTYPVNTWANLLYNQRYDWYHFDRRGYMQTGWFLDADGRWYYLNPVSDGTKGAMRTGWFLDADGRWYYLNPVSDGTKGAMRTGWFLDADGRWYYLNPVSDGTKGAMRTGWFQDADGRWYYLNPVSDGTKGAMVTGWKQIGDGWYYFNEVSDGYKGALYVNAVTPDGYITDSQGRRIQ